MGRRALRTVLAAAVLGLPLAAHADSNTFHAFSSERDYQEELQRLEGEYARYNAFGDPYRARLAETDAELQQVQQGHDSLVSRREALRTRIAEIEGSFQPGDPHLLRSIERVREQREQAYNRLDSDPSAIRAYDAWDSRLRQLERELARERASQIDEEALAGQRRELRTVESQLEQAQNRLFLLTDRRARISADLERALEDAHEIAQELANLRSQAPRALAAMRPPLLEAFETSEYNAEWIGEGRDDNAALERIEAEMFAAERQIMDFNAKIRIVERGMSGLETDLNASTQRYIELTGDMSAAGWTEAVLNTVIESGEAVNSVARGSGGNPVGALVNAGIELGTRYDSFIMAYRWANDLPMGDLVPAQRMAVASSAILAEREQAAGNHVIEAYRAWGLPVPDLSGTQPPQRRPGPLNRPSVAQYHGQFFWNTDRLKDLLKNEVEDLIGDHATMLTNIGLMSRRGQMTGEGWQRYVGRVTGEFDTDFRMRLLRRRFPDVAEDMLRSQARASQLRSFRNVSAEVLRQRYRESFRQVFRGQGFRGRLRQLGTNPGAARSAVQGVAFSLLREEIDQIEDLVRDGIMEQMVAEEVVWLQIRRNYHMLGAERQIYIASRSVAEDYLRELRAEYARISRNVRGRTLVINDSDVFRPGEYRVELTFSQEVDEVTVTSEQVELLGDVISDGTTTARFTFRVPEVTDTSPRIARFAISARHPRTEKGLDTDPATQPYYDGGSQTWQLWEQGADTNHVIRLQPALPGTAISIVFDDSGSMEGDRFARAQEGVRGLVASLRRRGDVEVALWTFSNGNAPLVDFTSDLAQVTAAVDAASPNSSTPLAATIDAAGNHLFDNSRYASRVLYVFSDGEDSTGANPADAIERLRRRALRTERRGF